EPQRATRCSRSAPHADRAQCVPHLSAHRVPAADEGNRLWCGAGRQYMVPHHGLALGAQSETASSSLMSRPPRTILAAQPFFSDLNRAPGNAVMLGARTIGFREPRIVFVAHPTHYEAVCETMPLLRARLEFRPTEVMRNGPPSRTRFRQHLAMLDGAIE